MASQHRLHIFAQLALSTRCPIVRIAVWAVVVLPMD